MKDKRTGREIRNKRSTVHPEEKQTDKMKEDEALFADLAGEGGENYTEPKDDDLFDFGGGSSKPGTQSDEQVFDDISKGHVGSSGGAAVPQQAHQKHQTFDESNGFQNDDEQRIQVEQEDERDLEHGR